MNQIVEKKKMTGAWIGLIISTLYILSPLDIIPDLIPVAGWLDDFLIGAIGVLNFFQHQAQAANSSLAGIVKFLKWSLIAIAIIVILLFLLLGTVIFSLFSK